MNRAALRKSNEVLTRPVGGEERVADTPVRDDNPRFISLRFKLAPQPIDMDEEGVPVTFSRWPESIDQLAMG